MDLYNDSHEKVCILSGIKETCITSTLKTGDKEITFEFRKTNRYAADIKEEGYIRTDRRLGAFVSENINMDAEFRDKLESELELLSAEASITGMNRDDFLKLCDEVYSKMKSSPIQIST